MAPIEPVGSLIEDRLPGSAKIVGLPHPAVHRADVEHVGLAGHARDGAGAATAKWTDVAPLHLGKDLGIDRLCEGGRNEAEKERRERTTTKFRIINQSTRRRGGPKRADAPRKCNLSRHIFAGRGL